MTNIVSLGFDTGLANLGYGVVRFDGVHMKRITCGMIRTNNSFEEPERLEHIYQAACQLRNEHQPQVSVVERYFTHLKKSCPKCRKLSGLAKANCPTCQKMKGKMDPNADGMNRVIGVLELALVRNMVVVWKPQTAKTAVTGSEVADKAAVEKGVKDILKLHGEEHPSHVWDGLALAIARIMRTQAYLRSGSTAHMPLFNAHFEG